MNPNAEKMILALDEKHSNAIPIFGGARLVQNISDLVSMLPSVIHSAKFFKWHAGLVDACRTFCHLCLVDPMLVEVYIGMRFEDLVKN